MVRYFLELAYDGTDFIGWQRQPKGRSAQGVLDAALSTLFRASIVTSGSGRTDVGVHAAGQVAHFELETPLQEPLEAFLYPLNALLPSDISVHAFYTVAADMHARFSAKARTYEYHATLAKNPFLSRYCAPVHTRGLDVEAMNEACLFLLGEQCVRTFSKSVEGEHYLSQTFLAKWDVIAPEDFLWGGGLHYRFTIRANRFLRGQVRAIVGAMLEVGRGKYTPAWFGEVLAAELDQVPTMLAPSEGLCLVKVEYA